jgi:hypothetical protein
VSESVDERSSVGVDGWHDIGLRYTVHSTARESAEAAGTRNSKSTLEK